jgi:hypothetical protein
MTVRAPYRRASCAERADAAARAFHEDRLAGCETTGALEDEGSGQSLHEQRQSLVRMQACGQAERVALRDAHVLGVAAQRRCAQHSLSNPAWIGTGADRNDRADDFGAGDRRQRSGNRVVIAPAAHGIGVVDAGGSI